MDTSTQPDGRVPKSYYSELGDERLVTLRYSDYETSPSTKYFGPVQYTVANHAGRAEVQATVGLTSDESTVSLTDHVDESATDPILAVETATNKLGDLVRMTVNVYDEPGQTLDESRPFFLIPASGSGTEGTNYDATFFGYDDQGRRYRVKEPSGTIRRADYDSLGRVVRQHIGTNDNGFDGGESSGTDDMVKVSDLTYDSGGVGNSYVTNRTAYVVDGTTDKRLTSFSHDVRGNVLLQTNPTAPHTFNKYDNMNRLTASGQFSSTANIVVGTDDPTTETSNRLALSQSFYDEMGRVWKSQRHEIDDADGSDDDNLQSLSWYDEAGRVIKVDGQQLAKTSYDRLGRQTHQFILASDNDTAYADADDVTGDIVLQESQTVFESTDSDDVLMTAVIERHHDDKGGSETTGALDSNADSDDLKLTATNVSGRPQITCVWYDRFGRQVDVVLYGMYDSDSDGDFDDFDRDGLSVPSRSDTALLTEYVYNTDGSLKSIDDPRSLETRNEYDDLGRQTLVIRNYVNGTPSGDNNDDDVHTRFAYTDGLRTKIWVDLDGDGTEDTDDQVTTYTYGTTGGGGANSEIATGHLLQQIKDPVLKVIELAYNAQNELVRRDAGGSVYEFDYDDSGRQEHQRVTTLASGLDNAVLRITTAFDSLGRRSTVTQYDNATVGSGSVVDQVKFTYDDWGNISKLEEDVNSIVGEFGDDYEISYTYVKNTSGRNTIRRTSTTMPDGSSVNYRYLATSDRHDADASRVTLISDDGPVALAEYTYNGMGTVVGIDHPEPDIMQERYGSTSGVYPDLDRFNRVTSSRWTKDLATDQDFYDADVTYDRNSNITLVEDNVWTAGVDVSYSMDNLDRLTEADRGTWSGSAITSSNHDQLWTLQQVGRIEIDKIDLNDDGDFSDAGEQDDIRTLNNVNELTARDVDGDETDDYTLSYDDSHNVTDDGQHYKYQYDAFGRLRRIKDQSDNAVAAYWYNGLGHRITVHQDTDADGDKDANDVKYHFVYDERWRVVATFHEDDGIADPKEQFVYHAAGASGLGGSSYIDAVILRDKDANVAWTAQSDGVLEERVYYLQNWRADVVALVDDSANQVEHARYSAYGMPFGVPAGDTDGDGDVDATDTSQIQTWIDAPAYDVRGDLDLDGDVDSTDKTAASNNSGASGGWGVLSDSSVSNRKGYAGYEFDDAVQANFSLWHVRHRVLMSDLGRWNRPDPIGIADSYNVYRYVGSSPIGGVDPTGLWVVLLATTYLDLSACPHSPISSQAQFVYKAVNLAVDEVPGWFIQKVRLVRNYTQCSFTQTPSSVNQSFTFWERTDLVADPENGPLQTDSSTPKALLNPSYGTIWSRADLRWVPASSSFITSGHPIDDPGEWPNLPGPPAHPSANPGLDGTGPSWWSSPDSRGNEVMNVHNLRWKCCGNCGRAESSDVTVVPAVTPFGPDGPGAPVGDHITWRPPLFGFGGGYDPARVLGSWVR